MDVSPVGAAMAQSQAQIQSGIAVGVLRKSLDIEAQQGAALIKLMDQGAGLGRQVDTLA
ncbi:MAG: putative motility protein [Holophagaceae bacterium]|nr:putative motility protein [Holophagaceae bacterium]